jgi:hypothetical protein
MYLSSFKHHVLNYLGSSGVSTSMIIGGKKLHLTSARHSSRVSARVTSGLTKLKLMLATAEIAPPIARQVDRDSGTFGVQSYDYGPVEIASEVGWDAYKKVADGIMRMLDKTGLLHGYSFNSWSDVITYDEAFIEDWLASEQTSLYYSLQVMGDTQDKTSAYAALEESEVDDYLESLLNDPAPDCNCGE